jgi:hypothetical protein
MILIPCEDGSFVYVPNITKLAIETDFDDKSRIKAHHNGPGMPFAVAAFGTRKDAQNWLLDLVARLESGTKATTGNLKEGIETR